jgi:hypothetical protein
MTYIITVRMLFDFSTLISSHFLTHLCAVRMIVVAVVVTVRVAMVMMTACSIHTPQVDRKSQATDKQQLVRVHLRRINAVPYQ